MRQGEQSRLNKPPPRLPPQRRTGGEAGSSFPADRSDRPPGQDSESGVKLAVDELNAEGVTIGSQKVKFELISEDDQADPKIATQVAQRLVDAKVAAVIGHLNSGTTIPASKVYSDAGIVQISPSATNPALHHPGASRAPSV